MSKPAPAERATPYKFLDYFVEEDAARFHGRERDTAEVIARIAKEQTCVLYGPSGTGKTSLLRAGVMVSLAERGYRTVYARVLGSPLEDVLTAVAQALKVSPDETATLAGLLKSASAPDKDPRAIRGSATPIVLVLDQLEELFTRFHEPLRKPLIEALGAALADPSLSLRVILSVRQDYLANLEDLRAAVPRVLDNRYRLGPLTSFGTREAIAKPLIDAGVDYSQKFLDELVDLLSARGFDPVELQIVCTEVYREAARRDSEPPSLDEADLRAVGGLDDIYRRYLDEATSRIDKSELLLARSLLDAMITSDRTKRAVTAQRLLEEGPFSAQKGEIEALLRHFTERRIIRAEERADELWYELVHDRLVPHVLAWLNLDRDFFEFRSARAIIESLSRSGLFRDKPGMLLSREQMDIISPFKERLRLDRAELEFVLRSAITSGSPDAGFWAEAFGREPAAHVLQHLLRSEREDTRISAGRALERLPGDELTGWGIQVALHDRSEKVRRAAGLALGRRLRADELETIWDRLTSAALGASMERVLEVLADLLQAGVNLARFCPRELIPISLSNRFDPTTLSASTLRRAMEIVDKRLEVERAHAIAARMSLSTTLALLTGGVWFVLVGWWLTLATTWMIGVPETSQLITVWVRDSILILGYVSLCGTMMARYGARRAVLNGARTGDEDWSRSILDPKAAALVALPLFLFMSAELLTSAGAVIQSLSNELASMVVIGALLFAGLLTAVALGLAVEAVRVAAPSARLASTRVRGMAIALLASVGIPLLPAAAASHIIGVMGAVPQDSTLVHLGWLMTIAVSPLPASVLFGLRPDALQGEPASPDLEARAQTAGSQAAPSPGEEARARRSYLVTAAVAAGAMLWLGAIILLYFVPLMTP